MSQAARDLIQRASAGDARAVDELLAQHLPGLERFVRRHAGALAPARESSSDLVQSVCREVLEDMDGFEYRGEAAFKAWLEQAALNKIREHARHHRAAKRDPARERPLALEGSQSAAGLRELARSLFSPSSEAMRREELARLARALALLPERDQLAIRAIYIEGLSHAEAAERAGTTEAASRKALSRALARLSKLL